MNSSDAAYYMGQERVACFERDNYVCQNCGESIYKHGTPQAAHRIAKTKANLENYGYQIINHRFNLKSACSNDICNSRWNIDNKTAQKMALIDKIKKDLAERETLESQTRQAFKDLIK